MAAKFKSIRQRSKPIGSSCNTAKAHTVGGAKAQLFLNSKVKPILDSKKQTLDNAKKLRSSNVPYISYAGQRSDPYTYLPIIFHVYEPNPATGVTDYFAGEMLEKVVAVMNEMLAGEVGEQKASYLHKYGAIINMQMDIYTVVRKG